ncbi:MAG TPA: SDR family NAD(P)-dependent oxidoreductase, partial [Chthoniobacterales bacterium]
APRNRLPAPEADDHPGWHLTPVWKDAPVDPQEPEVAGSAWYFYSGEAPAGLPFSESFAWDSFVSVKLGGRERPLGPNAWEVNVAGSDDLKPFLLKLPRPDYLIFAGPDALGGTEVDRVEDGQRRGVGALLQVIQALDQRGWLESLRSMRVITAGAQDVFDDVTAPYAAGLAGFAGSLAKEYPRLDIACLDVEPLPVRDPVLARRTAQMVLAEPAQRAGEKVAFRQGQRLRLHLQPIGLPPAGQTSFRKKGVYLILGGAGEVGFQLSVYLAETCQANLIWVGRRPLDGIIEAKASRVQLAGGAVVYLQAQGGDASQMEKAVFTAQERFGALNGIIHSALVFQDEPVRNLSPEVCREILNAKTRSAAVLGELARHLALDFLLFFGSAQSFFNEARRAAYAGACCFMDSYARYLRRSLKQPVQVIDWGFWSHSFDEELRLTMREAGLGAITPADGFRAMEGVLTAGTAQTAFLKASLDALRRMGIDPQQKLTCLSAGGEDLEELGSALCQTLSV